MITGKVHENVLKRSVLNKIKNKRSEVLVGADVGIDCAVLKFGEKELVTVTSESNIITDKEQASLSVLSAINNIATMGAEAVGLSAVCLLPVESAEEDLKAVMDELEASCKLYNLQLIGGHTQITKAVNRPIVTVTAIGSVSEEKMVTSKKAKPGNDIVVTKWAGLGATVMIAKEKTSDLTTKFPQKLVHDAIAFDKYLSVIPEAATAVKSGVTAMHDASEGGIFAALWQLGAASGVGLEINLKKIPIKQETIEICNYFDLNPYEILSTGSLVIATEDGNGLVSELLKAGINAVVVGKITDNNDRVVYTEDTRRFLEPVRNEEIYKLIN